MNVMSGHDWDEYRHEDVRLDEPPGPRTRSSVALLTALAALVVGGAVAVYFVFLRPSSSPVAQTAPAAVPRASNPPVSLGGPAEQIDVPPLEQTDPLVRRLVGGVSSSAAVSAWLSGNELLRNFVAVTVNLEEGATPAKLISRLRPNGAFRVIDRGGREVIDPRSFERYDAAADAIVGLDPARVARLYSTFKPRIEEAYRALGFGDRSFDRALQTVIVTLVRTPVPDDQPVVKRRGVRYLYADEAFEKLTAAQKQYLRTGPRNVRRIDEWLRRLADALGIPAAAFSSP
jgi:DUF3014 family protein